jgi:uncharacterized protein YodC (DUF2158 family)
MFHGIGALAIAFGVAYGTREAIGTHPSCICLLHLDIRDIFRHLSPHIVRHWKNVSRDLGLEESDIFEIEEGSPKSKVSELSYQALCLWHERVGRAATKARLIQTLQNLQLKRAEGEWTADQAS